MQVCYSTRAGQAPVGRQQFYHTTLVSLRVGRGQSHSLNPIPIARQQDFGAFYKTSSQRRTSAVQSSCLWSPQRPRGCCPAALSSPLWLSMHKTAVLPFASRSTWALGHQLPIWRRERDISISLNVEKKNPIMVLNQVQIITEFGAQFQTVHQMSLVQ